MFDQKVCTVEGGQNNAIESGGRGDERQVAEGDLPDVLHGNHPVAARIGGTGEQAHRTAVVVFRFKNDASVGVGAGNVIDFKPFFVLSGPDAEGHIARNALCGECRYCCSESGEIGARAANGVVSVELRPGGLRSGKEHQA